MPPVSASTIQRLQECTANIRNFCLLAHVDHGKTTLADLLIAANGIISSKIAGSVRYLDNRVDEIERGITMKSSAISLYFEIVDRTRGAIHSEYLLNLIDSPGHIDFSSEVLCALKLCDGCFVLVDAVEGICSQTMSVLRQAWTERMKPLLIINKLDRLALELKLTPMEAFASLRNLLEQINAFQATLYTAEFGREQQYNPRASDEDIYFSPEKDNVIFASAVDGWAFRARDFARMFSKKLKVDEELLLKYLWGDYDLRKSQFVALNRNECSKSKPLFVKLCIENIWAIYNYTIMNKDNKKIEKIINTLNLKISASDMHSKKPRRLSSIMLSQWLPLARAVLLAAIFSFPSPVDAQKERVKSMLNEEPSLKACPENIKEALKTCDASSEVIVAFVSKLCAIQKSELPIKSEKSNSPKSIETSTSGQSSDTESMSDRIDQTVIGFARVLSGRLQKGQKIWSYGPKYNPSISEEAHKKLCTIENLYIIMGKDMVEIESVSAGNICGILGLKGIIKRTGTLSSEAPGVNLVPKMNENLSIVRVAIEPKRPSDLIKLESGLNLLSMSDPSAEYVKEKTGEHLLYTAGDLHLEKCIKDLTEQFAKVEVKISAPIVPFHETIVDTKSKSDTRGYFTFEVARRLDVMIRTIPLTDELREFLNENSNLISQLQVMKYNKSDETKSEIYGKRNLQIFLSKLDCLIERWDLAKSNMLTFSNAIGFGSKKSSINIIFDKTGCSRISLGSMVRKEPSNYSKIVDEICSAFNYFLDQGPLCSEPVEGIGLVILKIAPNNIEDRLAYPVKNFEKTLLTTDQLFSQAKNAILRAFSQWSSRLMLAMYLCEIQTTLDAVGRVYTVVSRRRGRIIEEALKDGTSIFCIKSLLPVIESFGFSEELRKQTSGSATAQLMFHGFEILDIDPFWIPTSEEELEELGNTSDRENQAKVYINAVRERKGLAVEKKIVEHAEKQRTMKK